MDGQLIARNVIERAIQWPGIDQGNSNIKWSDTLEMKPVYQTIIDPKDGNCFAACLASVLEMELDEIPHFLRLHGQQQMLPEARKWMAENYGISILTINVTGLNRTKTLRPFTPGAIILVSGKSKTFPEATHVVVGRIINDVNDYELIHDPNPSGKGLDGDPYYYYYFVLLDPARKFVHRDRRK